MSLRNLALRMTLDLTSLCTNFTMTGRIVKEVDVKTIGITQIGVTMPVIMQMMKGMTPMSLAACVTPTMQESKEIHKN